MAQEQKHTALPYKRISSFVMSGKHIIAKMEKCIDNAVKDIANDGFILDVTTGQLKPLYADGDMQANAQFMVTACNSYYDYEHIIKELLGVIAEYRAMPCKSLEQRMFESEVRYRLRFEAIKKAEVSHG